MWRWGKLEVVLSGSLTGQDRLKQWFASLVDCNDRGVPAAAVVVVAAADADVAVAEDAAAAEDAVAAATLAALHHNLFESAFPARNLLPDCS